MRSMYVPAFRAYVAAAYLIRVFCQRIPFLLEDKIKELGGKYERVENWGVSGINLVRKLRH